MEAFFETGRSLRVNGGVLGAQAQGNAVTVVGRVTAPDVVTTSDGVEVRLVNEGVNVPANGIVEIVGAVVSSTSVKTVRATDLGDDFDLATYAGLLDHIHGKYRHLFY